MRVSELVGVTDGEFDLEDIFVFRMAGVDQQTGKVLGSFYSTGYEPQCLRRMASTGHGPQPADVRGERTHRPAAKFKSVK